MQFDCSSEHLKLDHGGTWLCSSNYPIWRTVFRVFGCPELLLARKSPGPL
jgi:hypothetical protein